VPRVVTLSNPPTREPSAVDVPLDRLVDGVRRARGLGAEMLLAQNIGGSTPGLEDLRPRLGPTFNEGLAPRLINGGWRFATPKGDVAIQGPFLAARGFSEGYAAVRVEEGWTFVNRHGVRLTRQTFDKVDDFEGGRARVWVGQQQQWLKASGELERVAERRLPAWTPLAVVLIAVGGGVGFFVVKMQASIDDRRKPFLCFSKHELKACQLICQDGDVEACMHHAKMLAQGLHGHAKDPDQATRSLQEACKHDPSAGCTDTMLEGMALHGEGLLDDRQATRLLITSCAKGRLSDTSCQLAISRAVRLRSAAPPLPEMLIKYYHHECTRGFLVVGCADVSTLLLEGWGVPADPERGAEIRAYQCSGSSPIQRHGFKRVPCDQGDVEP